MRPLQTEEPQEIAERVNEIVDFINDVEGSEDEDIGLDYLPSTATTEDIVYTLNNLIQTLKGEG